MKKRWIIIICATGCWMLTSTDVQAQNFLKKLKQKAEKAIEKVIDQENNDDKKKNEDKEEEIPVGTPSAIDRLPKLRKSTVVWDGEVQPSRAVDPQALLNELPPLPTAEEIANPDDATRTIYYNKLYAIKLRVDELDEEYSCSDEEMLAARDKIYKELEGVLGVTAEEMKRLEDDKLPEAERQRLEEKIKAKLLGGNSIEEISAVAESKQARMEELSKETEALEAKEKAGTLTEADKKRAMEIQQELMAVQQELMGSMSGAMEMANKAQKMNTEMAGLERQLKVLSDKMVSLRKNEAGVVKSCGEIADEYEARLKSIYEQIWVENNSGRIHTLYDEADALMKNYRLRAAKIFLQGLRVRLNNTQKLLPEAEKIYTEMADCEMIPQCATRRASLNVVTQCLDILNEAYAYFPQPEVLPVKKEAFEFLKKGEIILYAESGFAGGFSGGGPAPGNRNIIEEFIAGSHVLVYNEAEQCFYEMSSGKRRKLEGDGPFDLAAKVKHTPETYGEIPLRGGSRKAVYSRDGSLTLHDGTILYPLLIKRYTDRLEFIVYDYFDTNKFIKCTYKL